MDRKDETMNLDAIKDMLRDATPDEELDLDSILAEFESSDGKGSLSGRGNEAEPPLFHNKDNAVNPRLERDTMGDTTESPMRESIKRTSDMSVDTIGPPGALRDTAESDDYDEEEDEPEDVKPRKRSRKMKNKEAKAARRAAELAEEDEEIQIRDPAQAARVMKKQAHLLSLRSILVLIIGTAAAYLSIAPQIEVLPLPPILNVTSNTSLGIGILILLQLIALIIGIDIFGMGFTSLLHGTPDRATLVSFTVLAGLLHAASIIILDNENGVEVPYLAVSILMLYASMRDERGRLHAQAKAYSAISMAHEPMAVYSHFDSEENIFRAVKGPLHSERAFLLEMERPDSVDRFSMIYVPLVLGAAIIISFIASVGQGEPMRMFWAFSAIMSVCAPVGLLSAYGAGYKNTSSRLFAQGAAIAGARQAQLLRGTEEVVLSESDIYPPGCVSLDSMRNLSSIADGKVLACAAALTEAAGLELGHVLTELTRERYGVTLSARNVQLVEGGVKGRIGASNVIVGSQELMLKMGMNAQSESDGASLYLVIDNVLSGIFSLRYQPTKATYQAMRLMRRMHMNAMLAARDFNISPAMVEQEFDLNRGFTDQKDPAGSERLLDPNYTKGDAPAAILTRSGAGPFMDVLKCADKLAGAVRSALTLSTVAGVGGMAIVFYLVFHNAVEALSVLSLLGYQFLWYIPVFLIIIQTRL